MRIVAIYPGLDPTVNDIAQALASLADLGHDVTVITAEENWMKSSASGARFEQFRGIAIHRPYRSFRQMVWFPHSHAEEIRSIVLEAKPDIIFCSQELNMRIAKMIQRFWPKPIVLAVELAGELADGHSLHRFLPYVMPFFGVPTRGKRYWRWLTQNTRAIITYNPDDQARLPELSASGTPVTYIPWCNELPLDFVMPTERHNRLIFIGAFSKWKNTEAFRWAIPLLLEQTPTESALLIGPGEIDVVTELQNRYGDRVQYMSGCSRNEALELIASSFYAFTPVRFGFGGLIGDAWSTDTPLVATHFNTVLRHMEHALVPASEQELVQLVNRLYSEPELYETMQRRGRAIYEQHSAQSVASKIATVLEQVAERQEPSSWPAAVRSDTVNDPVQWTAD